MIEHLKSIAIFAEVVRMGQFRAAANRLKMTPSAVSYHIRVLEEAVGTPLLYRSTRRFTLTASGSKLYESAEQMLNAAQSGFSDAQLSQTRLSGQLKITLTTALSHSFISERITSFALDHPKVELELQFDNRETDLVAEGIDIAIRIGSLRDSSLLCKRLWDMPRLLVSSPKFALRFGPFEKPEDLRNAPWIKFSGLKTQRTFETQGKTEIHIEQKGNLTVNSIEAMVDLTCNGAGLSSPPTHFVDTKVESGELTHCLPDYKLTDLPVYIIWHRTSAPNILVKALVDHISGQRLIHEDTA